jgi:GrpB-like predicted nucleotidyltransferase (UPF0157 family)
MNDSSSYAARKFSISPYKASWRTVFNEYAQIIKEIYPEAKIEHIGSTAVEGMSGKDTIDVLVIVENLQQVQDKVDLMEAVGFQFAGEFIMRDSLLFRKMDGNELLANIHFFPAGHKHVGEMLGLREYLRNNPEEVKNYSALKLDLYTKYKDDYTSYRKYKDQYMKQLIERSGMVG